MPVERGPGCGRRAPPIPSTAVGGRYLPFLLLTRCSQPPFITVTCKGTSGQARVQTEPCVVTSGAYVVVPSDDNIAFGALDRAGKIAHLCVVAAAIERESWRFSRRAGERAWG